MQGATKRNTLCQAPWRTGRERLVAWQVGAAGEAPSIPHGRGQASHHQLGVPAATYHVELGGTLPPAPRLPLASARKTCSRVV